MARSAIGRCWPRPSASGGWSKNARRSGSAFDDRWQVWETVLGDPRVRRTTVASIRNGTPNVSQQAMAIPSLFAAAEPEPLGATLRALSAAAHTFGREGRPALFAEVRRAFGL